MSASALVAQNPEEASMARHLVQALNLQHVAADEIVPTAPLFGHEAGSLGLDSIDALELGVAIQKRYGIILSAKAEENRRHFASVRALAEMIATVQKNEEQSQ